jgi:hypothetical protein
MDETNLKRAGAGSAGQHAIAHGQRVSAETDMVSDSDQIARVRFRRPIDQPLPVEGATVLAPQGFEPGGASIGDVGAVTDGSSVWEALPDEVFEPHSGASEPAGRQPRDD